MILIRTEGIKKTYDGKRYVLNGIDLSVEEGEIATVRGASGCGKSTFLNILGLLDNANEGKYFFCGEEIGGKLNSYSDRRSRDIGFIFQSYCLIDQLSAEDNILMPFLYGKGASPDIGKRLSVLLKDLNIEGLREKKVSLLSGGERQRVAIARAMIKCPRLIIADEPTGNLDDVNTHLVIKALEKASRSGTSVIVVTHNTAVSFGEGSRYRMEGGMLKHEE